MERQLWLDRGFDLQLRYSKDCINTEIARLAAEISSDFSGQSILIVVVLKGAFFFAADLVRALKVPVELDYVTLSSYEGTATTGTVVIKKDLNADIAGRHVLVLEDIVDTGLTLTRLIDLLQERGPESLNICTLIDKKERRQAEVEPKYVGIACDGGFLVGYGLDLDEQMRELSNIYEVRQTPGGTE